ncbi:MAG: PDZ domain-containing protein [Verrucomicrobiota bacterium]
MKPFWIVPLLFLAAAHAEIVIVEAGACAREFELTETAVRTLRLVNHLDEGELQPAQAEEFILHWEDGRQTRASELEFRGGEQANPGHLELSWNTAGYAVVVEYQADAELGIIRKTIALQNEGGTPLSLKRIELESMVLPGAVQPYTIRQIPARGPARWRTGLGQPLYTEEGTGSFWGIEFPAALNSVANGKLSLAHFVSGGPLTEGTSWTSHPAVFGVSDDPAFIRDAFLAYIEAIRAHPFRLRTQYNSWFDFDQSVNQTKMLGSLEIIRRELVDERGQPNLESFVIDDGWQIGGNWDAQVWPVSPSRFDPNFGTLRAALAAADAELGLWLSPGMLFGAEQFIPRVEAQLATEGLNPWMPLDDGPYMNALQQRMKWLAGEGGVEFFKLDGLFGHLNTRNFRIAGFQGGEAALDVPQFDEAKLRYLSAGTERLIELFEAVRAVNPDVYLVISNGAWLSPWWLQSADACWMINAGDAADGANRIGELVYRDGVYRQLLDEGTQFPLDSIFNHDPKKTSTGESAADFRAYLYACFSRATGLAEVYLKPSLLSNSDWNVVAEGLIWLRHIAPTFPRARMHGGNPGAGQVFGYTGWTATQGYLSLVNPGQQAAQYSITLDRAFGLVPGQTDTRWFVSSPLDGSLAGVPAEVETGATLEFTLQPGEVRVLDFARTAPTDWSASIAFQPLEKPSAWFRWLGARVKSVFTAEEASAFGRNPAAGGIFFTADFAGSAAAAAGLLENDLIVAINGTAVRTVEEMVALLSSAAGNVTFGLIRNQGAFSLVVPASLLPGAGTLALEAGVLTVAETGLSVDSFLLLDGLVNGGGTITAGTIEVRQGTASVGLASTGTWLKTGDGMAIIGGSVAAPAGIRINGGTLKLDPTLAPLVKSGLIRRLDAAAAATLTSAEGKISRWIDADGNGSYVEQTAPEKYPGLLAAAQNGRPVVDLGSYFYGSRNGKFMSFKDEGGADGNDDNIRTAFWVMKGANHLLTHTGSHAFHRGTGDGATMPAAATANLWGSATHANVTGGSTFLNGAPINGLNTGLSATSFNLVSLVTSGSVAANTLCADRTYRFGGQQIAEVILYGRALSAAERQRVEAYLRHKWFGAPAPASTALAGAEVAAGAALDLGNGFTHALGTLTLRGDARLEVSGSLINQATIDIRSWTGSLPASLVNQGTILTAPFVSWIESFPALADPADRREQADPDHDGLNNLGEFALNGDPIAAGANSKMRSQIATVAADDYLTHTIPVRSGADFNGSGPLVAQVDGIIYSIQGTTDLVDFDAGVVEIPGPLSAGMPVPSAGWEYRSFRLAGPSSTTPRGFLRIVISRAP